MSEQITVTTLPDQFAQALDNVLFVLRVVVLP